MSTDENPKPNSNTQSEITIAELVVLTGVHRQTISSRLEALRVPFRKGARGLRYYSIAEIMKVVFQLSKKVDESKDLSPIDAAKLKLAESKAAEAELDLKERQGELIPINEVLSTVEHEYTVVRAQLRSLPSALATHLANSSTPKECFDLLSTAIDESLSTLSADSIPEKNTHE